MSTQRKEYSADFKARVALEALKGLKTIIVDGYVVHGRPFRFSLHHTTKSSSRACSTTVNPISVYETMPRMSANGRGNK